VLAEHLAAVQADKQALLAAAGITDDNLTPLLSDAQFAVKLWYLGVKELPRKNSKTTGKEQYAFAKTDKQFTALLEHPNPRVQALVAARLGVKSTLEESRTERLLTIGRLTPQAPVPLRYSGAHTHRFSGDWKLNLQNLPNRSDIRRGLKAPKGRKVVSADASQIEARLNAVLSGQNDLVEDFRNGVDVYSKFAQDDIYHYPVSKAQKQERFVGKQGILSLGYGSSPPVFQNMVRVKSDPLKPIILQDSEAISIVYLYRARFKKIVENWRYAGNVVIPRLAFGETHTGNFVQETVDALTGGGGDTSRSLVPWGPLVIEKNRIVLPNDNCLYYPDLHQVTGDDGSLRWVFRRAEQTVHLYGAKLVENVIQALAFVHIMDVAKRVYEITNGYLWPAHQVHDELVYVTDEQLAEQVSELVVKEMSVAPWWMPTAPLAAEGHIGDSYGDLK
jgi:DNA polymerase